LAAGIDQEAVLANSIDGNIVDSDVGLKQSEHKDVYSHASTVLPVGLECRDGSVISSNFDVMKQ
jgi:hypothetical protein